MLVYSYHKKGGSMKLIKQFALIILFFSCLPVSGVQFINVTRDEIYFSVFYKRGESVIRQIPTIYTAMPNGVDFLRKTNFDIKDKNLKIAFFLWPKQKCLEFSDAEMAAMGVGVGLTAATVGAVAGAAGGVVLGVEAAGAAGMEAAVGTGLAGAGGGALAGSSLGTVGAVFEGHLCKENYPRTVLFSFTQGDIVHMKYDLKALLLGQSGNGLYLGDNVDGGETHFLFYNMHGFDPRYAAQGKREGHNAIKGGRINSQPFYDLRIPEVLRNYLRFADYYVYGI